MLEKLKWWDKQLMLSHDTKQPMKLKGFLSYIEAHRQGKTTFSWLVALHIKDFLWYIIYRAAFLVVGLVILLVIITVWLVDSRVPLTLAVCVLWLLITIPIARNRVLIEQNQRRLRDGNFQAQLTPLLYTRLTITKPLPMMGNSAILPNFCIHSSATTTIALTQSVLTALAPISFG